MKKLGVLTVGLACLFLYSGCSEIIQNFIPEDICGGWDVVLDERDTSCTVYFRDQDDDGFGAIGDTLCLDEAQGHYTASEGGDCDDTDPAVGPHGLETWNGRDDDCDGVADDGIAVLAARGDGTAHHPSIATAPDGGSVFLGWVEGQHTYQWGTSFHIGILQPGEGTELIATYDQGPFLYHSDSNMETDPLGRLHVVWHVSGSMNEEMAYISVSPEGVPGPANQISDGSGLNVDIAHVAPDAEGRIHTIWAADQAGPGISNLYYQQFQRNMADGTVSMILGQGTGIPLTDAVTEHPQRRCDLILDPAGNPLIVHLEEDHIVFLALERDTGSILTGPVAIAPSDFTSVMIGATRNGRMYVAFVAGGEVRVAEIDREGSLTGGPHPVGSGENPESPGILVSQDGSTALIAWIRTGVQGSKEVYGQWMDPRDGHLKGGSFPVSPDDGVSSFFLHGHESMALGADGSMHLVWTDRTEGNETSVHTIRFALPRSFL